MQSWAVWSNSANHPSAGYLRSGVISFTENCIHLSFLPSISRVWANCSIDKLNYIFIYLQKCPHTVPFKESRTGTPVSCTQARLTSSSCPVSTGEISLVLLIRAGLYECRADCGSETKQMRWGRAWTAERWCAYRCGFQRTEGKRLACLSLWLVRHLVRLLARNWSHEVNSLWHRRGHRIQIVDNICSPFPFYIGWIDSKGRWQ